MEDGEEKFNKVCSLAKKYGAVLICLAIDEKGMAKTKERKVEVSKRMYNLATKNHSLRPEDIIFDVLTFTVGSGDEEYRDSAIHTVEAIKELREIFPNTGTTLGLSNISFGLNRDARLFLNSIFLHYAVKAGLTSVIINVKHIIPLNKMDKKDIEICEELLFRADKNSLFKFIEHFSDKKVNNDESDEEFEKLDDESKIKKLLMDGDKDRMIKVVDEVHSKIGADKIVNEILIEGMKEIGELFGSGKMQLPFVLQSAETMKATAPFSSAIFKETGERE